MELDLVNDIHPLLKERKSIFAYADRSVSDDTLDRLFEAARWAPSSFNEQPWAFLYAKKNDGAVFDTLFELIFEGNQSWAKTAPLLVLTLSKKRTDFNGQINHSALHDVGMAESNFIFQATHEGLYVHQMGGFDRGRAREALDIPEKYDPIDIMAVGYPGNIDELDDDRVKKRASAARTRNPVNSFVFRGGF